MRIPALLLGVVLLGSSLVLAAPPKGAMLLSGEKYGDFWSQGYTTSVSVNAMALIGDFRVTANEIVFDRENKLLFCRGVKTISAGYAVPGVKNVTIPVDVSDTYLLNPEGVVVGAGPALNASLEAKPSAIRTFDRAHPELPTPTLTAPNFSTGLPKLDLNLSSRQ